MTWVKPWSARMSRNRVCCEVSKLFKKDSLLNFMFEKVQATADRTIALTLGAQCGTCPLPNMWSYT